MSGEAKMPKREHRRLARAEIWMQLAMTAQRWADEVTGQSASTAPVDEWPQDEPLVALMRAHNLSAADLGAVLTDVGQVLENKAIASGYEDCDVCRASAVSR